MCRTMSLLLGTLLLAGSQVAAADPVQEQLQKQWQATGDQITTIAEAVPEYKYDYKPTPDVRSFREILQHLAAENFTYMGFAAGEKNDTSRFANMKTRAELLKALSEGYDYGEKVLAGMTDQKLIGTVPFRNQQATRLFIIISNMKDNHEHYGNVVTYLRLNGIVPPRTAARQQQQQR